MPGFQYISAPIIQNNQQTGTVAVSGKNSFTSNSTNLNSPSETLVFPPDLTDGNTRNFYISFYFYQYKRPSVFNPVYTAPIGVIQLPLPSQLIDAQDVSWDTMNFADNPALGASLEAAAKNRDQTIGMQVLNDGLAGLVGTVTGGFEKLVSAGIAKLTGGSAAGAPAAALQFAGLAVNPFLTVLFKSTAFKRHRFSWRFTPNNLKESQRLRTILNKFRYHQLPEVSSYGGVFFDYPDLVTPVITPAGYVYSFKHCVIESASVNFAPGMTPGFHNSSAPNTVELQISLLEVELFRKSDLTDGSDPNYTTNPPGGFS